MKNTKVKRTINEMRKSDVGRWATINTIYGKLDGVICQFDLVKGRVRGYEWCRALFPALGEVCEVRVYDILEIRDYVIPQ